MKKIVISQTTAASKLSAWLVVNKKGEKIATITALKHNDDRLTVNVKAKENGRNVLRTSTVRGGGYDKLKTCLHGFKIEGVDIYDDATPVPGWKPGRPSPKGAELTNWNSEKGMFTSCFYIGGLERLKAFGYCVYQVI